MSSSSHSLELDNGASSMLLPACSGLQHGSVADSWQSALFNALIEKDLRQSVRLMRCAQIVLEDRLAELAFAESSYAAEELDLCACLTYLRILLKGAAKEKGEIVWD